VPKNPLCEAIEHEDHENVAILGIDQDVFEPTDRIPVHVRDCALRTVVALKVWFRNGVELRPEIERRTLGQIGALHGPIKGCLKLGLR
jgi:hypothetical protein